MKINNLLGVNDSPYATLENLEEYILANIPADVDLSNYYTKEEVDNGFVVNDTSFVFTEGTITSLIMEQSVLMSGKVYAMETACLLL